MKYTPRLEKEIMRLIEYGLDIFGGKWKSRILCALSSAEVMRYNEIREELGNITDAVLTAMLKELIANGLINRTQHNEIPLKVEYSLIQKGKSVFLIPQNIRQWSRTHTTASLDKKLPPCKTCSQLPS